MSGRPPRVSTTAILELLAESDDRVLGTKELAERADMSRQGMINRLVSLEIDGYVGSHDIGNARAWWITEAGLDELFKFHE